jgi:chromosome partitioning protein
MAKIIAFSIYKGGTGKTTSAVNTAATLAEAGKRVLLIDLDQQAQATKYLGVDPDTIAMNVAQVFMQNMPLGLAVQHTPFAFDLVPANELLSAVENAVFSQLNCCKLSRKSVKSAPFDQQTIK